MATYTEIRALYNDSGMRNRIAVAIAITANMVMTSADSSAPFNQTAGNHAKRVAWAKEALGDTEQWTNKFWQAVLATNASATVAQITGASDSVLQDKVNAAVDLFAGVDL